MKLEDQYVVIVHNKAKHIPNVVMHILLMDMHTFLP